MLASHIFRPQSRVLVAGRCPIFPALRLAWRGIERGHGKEAVVRKNNRPTGTVHRTVAGFVMSINIRASPTTSHRKRVARRVERGGWWCKKRCFYKDCLHCTRFVETSSASFFFGALLYARLYLTAEPTRHPVLGCKNRPKSERRSIRFAHSFSIALICYD